jgi:hypothetical protein
MPLVRYGRQFQDPKQLLKNALDAGWKQGGVKKPENSNDLRGAERALSPRGGEV